MLDDFPWIKFLILVIPFSIAMFVFVDGFKWKILFTFAGIIGVGLALAGKTMKGLTPIGRRF